MPARGAVPWHRHRAALVCPLLLLLLLCLLPWSVLPGTGIRLAAAAQAADSGEAHGWINSVRFLVGVPLWRWYSHAWVDRTVSIRCPAKGFNVYTASSVAGLQEARDSRRTASCGLMHLLQPLSRDCQVALSPFDDMYVAVEILPGWLAPDDASECSFATRERLSYWRPLVGLAGAALFLNAAPLSHSLAFRLCAGTATFVLLSVLIVAVIAYRHLPNRRVLVAGSMLAASFPVIVEHFAETWLPGVKAVTSNQLFLAYIAITALAGLCVTYYYDNPGNAKLLTILEAAMRGGGLLMVYAHSPSAAVGAAAVAVLLCAWAAARLGISADHAELITAALRTAAVKLGLLRWVGRAGRAVMRGRVASRAPPAADPSVAVPPPPPPPEERAAQAALGRSPAPRSPFSPQRRLAEPRKLEAPPALRPDGGGRHRHGAASPRPSTPLRAREAAGHRAGATPRATQRLPARVAGAEPAVPVSPLVQRGVILNMETGRTIGIGKGKYNELIARGFVEDRAMGTLTPPPPRRP